VDTKIRGTTQAIKHMLYCRLLKCVLLNFASNVGQRCRYLNEYVIAKSCESLLLNQSRFKFKIKILFSVLEERGRAERRHVMVTIDKGDIVHY
jgi:hypothetical protein